MLFSPFAFPCLDKGADEAGKAPGGNEGKPRGEGWRPPTQMSSREAMPEPLTPLEAGVTHSVHCREGEHRWQRVHSGRVGSDTLPLKTKDGSFVCPQLFSRPMPRLQERTQSA